MHRSDPTWQGREAFLPLEPRTLLSTVQWDGGGDGVHWSDPVNWSGDAIPSPADDVVINIPGSPTIAHDTGLTVINSLNCRESLALSGGGIDVAHDWFQAAPLHIAGGSISGTGNLVLSGVALWSSGDIGGPGKLQIVPGGSLQIDGGAGQFLGSTRQIVNNGSLSWTSGHLDVSEPLLNLAGHVFDITSPGGSLTGAGQLSNAGTINLGGTSLDLNLPVYGTSQGSTINVTAPTVRFRRGLINASNLVLGPSTVTTIDGFSKFIAAGSITGSGYFRLTNVGVNGRGHHYISCPVTMTGTLEGNFVDIVLDAPTSVASLRFDDGDLRGAGPVHAGAINVVHGGYAQATRILDFHLTVDGPATIGVQPDAPITLACLSTFNGPTTLGGVSIYNSIDGAGDMSFVSTARESFWHGGTIGGSGRATIQPGVRFTLARLEPHFLSRALDNFGTLTAPSNIVLNAVLTNHGLLIAGNNVVDYSNPNIGYLGTRISGGGTLRNLGQLLVPSGYGLHVSATLDNPGTVSRYGTLDATSIAQVVSNTLTAGTWINFFPNVEVNQAHLILLPDPLHLPRGLSLRLNSGVIDVTDGLGFTIRPVGGTFTNAGTISLGLTDFLVVEGAFVQTDLATLNLAVYDQNLHSRITATGAITAGGTLHVSVDPSFAPVNGHTPAVILFTGSSVSGRFARTDLPTLPPPRPGLTIGYYPTEIRLDYVG